MSDENFFTRWSRRKAKAESVDAEKSGAPKPADNAKAPEESSHETRVAPQAREPTATPDAAAEPAPFDPKNLPSIESIGPGTDVSAFLRPGIPAELARAALRRAWTTDPAIRDYIGPSENAWDFTAPHGVPGFGPLSADDARRLLAEFIGQREEVEQKGRTVEGRDIQAGDRPQGEQQSNESALPPANGEVARAQAEGAREHPDPRMPQHANEPPRSPQREEKLTAAQHIHSGGNTSTGSGRRHGGALPDLDSLKLLTQGKNQQ
jgi:hypothetical protein